MAGLQFVKEPGYAGLILRRTYADLALAGAIMDRAHEWLTNTDAHWIASTHTWQFPTEGEDATLTFGYLESENDKYRYQSAEFQYIAFDELTQFTETQYSYLFSRLRRLKGVDIPLRMRAGSNPGGVGHDWVKTRFNPGGKSPAPSRQFIGARLDDNPYVDQQAYENALSKLDYVTRIQLRQGDWEITDSGGIFLPENLHVYPVKNKDFRKDPDLNGARIYASCDPSEGGHDFASLGVVLKLQDNRLLVWYCDMAVDTQSQTIKKIVDLQRVFGPEKIWIEANSLGHAKSAKGMSLFEKELRAQAAAAQITIPFEFVWTVHKKADRIRSMEPHYSNGTLLFRSDWPQEYPDLVAQLKGFAPNSKMPDDGPDQLEMAVSHILNEIKIKKISFWSVPTPVVGGILS
jgi:predicted phage terminase large subunit-like protein